MEAGTPAAAAAATPGERTRQPMIDSHCHIDAAEFDHDRDAVLARARAAGVVAQIVPAVALSGFDKLRDLCAAHADLHPAYGLHPM